MRNIHTIVVASISLLLLFVSIAACVFLVYSIERKKTELHELGLRKAQAEIDAEALVSLSTALSQTEEDRLFVASRILKDENVIEFLTLIESLGKEQGVVLVTDKLTLAPINSSFESLVLGLSVEGQYASLMNLLTLFESLPYQVTVEKVQLERLQSDDNMMWRSVYDIVVTKEKKKL